MTERSLKQSQPTRIFSSFRAYSCRHHRSLCARYRTCWHHHLHHQLDARILLITSITLMLHPPIVTLPRQILLMRDSATLLPPLPPLLQTHLPSPHRLQSTLSSKSSDLCACFLPLVCAPMIHS